MQVAFEGKNLGWSEWKFGELVQAALIVWFWTMRSGIGIAVRVALRVAISGFLYMGHFMCTYGNSFLIDRFLF